MTKKRDDMCRKVALIHGVSPDYVRKIRNGDRDNEAIMNTIMDFREGEEKLLEEVKKLAEQDRANAIAQKCKPCGYYVGKD